MNNAMNLEKINNFYNTCNERIYDYVCPDNIDDLINECTKNLAKYYGLYNFLNDLKYLKF